jgi:monofunctional biosynthetic peptidoglycan transglycosylase
VPIPRAPFRRRVVLELIVAGLLVGALADLPFFLERRVRARLQREAAERGFSLAIGEVRFSLPPRVELYDVVLEGHGGGGIAARVTVGLRPALSLRRALRTISYERAVVSAPGELVVDLRGSSWSVGRLEPGEVRLERDEVPGSILLRWSGGGLSLSALSLDLGRLARVRFGGVEPMLLGTVSGSVSAIQAGAGGWNWDLSGESRGVRVAALSDEGPARFGAPLELSLAASGVVHPAARRIEVSCLKLGASGAVLEAEGVLAAGEHDVAAEGNVRMARASLADILATSGIPLDGGGDLGSVALSLSGSGHLKDPSSIRVEQRLAFTPPAAPPPELLPLRAPFVRTLESPQGPHSVDLTPGAPDFLPLEEVPPLFLRTLLISEDAGFWGHPGIDLQEIPVAFATNWNRGLPARGASTITQQLAKNLFLSRRKSYGRKLQELALTLLLESTLGKSRILEIYVNVIEWGPGVYGLRAAARHYFGKEPRNLTPREGAFLVALIPGPIKYQASFRGGELTPRFAVLVDNLLAKLRSVDALTEEEYQAAREEELCFGGDPSGADGGSPPEAPRTDAPEPTAPSPAAPAAPGS